MATLNYSRFSTDTLVVEVDSLFDAIIDVGRSDSGSVVLTSKTLKLDIMTKFGTTPIVTLASGVDFTITASYKLTFSKTFTELVRRTYDYELYNETDGISIAKGKLIAE